MVAQLSPLELRRICSRGARALSRPRKHSSMEEASGERREAIPSTASQRQPACLEDKKGLGESQMTGLAILSSRQKSIGQTSGRSKLASYERGDRPA